jgi:hypothetical protein
MTKVLRATILLSLSASAFSAEFMEFGAKDFKSKKMDKSRWALELGGNYMQYPTALPSFKGAHANIKNEQDYDVYGLNLAFGREFYLGANVSMSAKVGGFYSKTMSDTKAKAAKDIDLDLASIKNDHMVYGTDATVSLNYMIETSIIGIQPFIEFGVGAGQSAIEKTYDYKGLAGSLNPNPESYNMKSNELFGYNKSSVGINFVGFSGMTSFLKVTRLGMNVNEREYKGSIKTASDTSKQPVNSKSNPNDSLEVMMVSLGLGFLF